MSAASTFVRQVVVDDTDPAISYGPEGWFVADPSVLTKGNWGPIYNGTSHATASTNSTLSFSFKGTSITVKGSVIISTDTNNITDPTWTCSVDGTEIPSNPFNFPENNWPLCNQPQMASGAHTLTIQVKSKGQPFYIDHLEYHPLLEAVFPSAVLVYSDSDPALTYGAGWAQGDGMSTQTAGSNATLSFYGTSATLIAYISGKGPPNAIIAHYTIDGGAPVTFQLTGQSGAQYNQVIFTTPGLPDGPHNLTVTHGGDINHTPLSVKYFFVTNTTTVASTASSLSSTGTSVYRPTSTVLVSPHRAENISSAIDIVGGVGGGVFLLAVQGAIYVWYRRRQRRATGEASMFSPYPMSGSDTARPFVQLSGYFARTRKRGFGATGEVPRPSRAKRASPLVRTVRHEDSGLRLEDGAQRIPEIVELPPGYTPL
ncbi:hypothetical protein DFH08DRAFT_781072 [Mycena albidolilacea]|uniref:Uncharacterized protein n=1 Tax=Mycena albidolilacea TaxID=1033008 RepID=A0AAD6ZZY9_9AGAR|nr:hypothetical protein DFH08DRAFT_781072 [Mycena albidolilacea]